jgi:hypothetical protein
MREAALSNEATAAATAAAANAAANAANAAANANAAGGSGASATRTAASASAVAEQLEPMRRWLALAEAADGEEGRLRLASLAPRPRNLGSTHDCYLGALEGYWWLLRLSARDGAAASPAGKAGGQAAKAGGQSGAEAAAAPPSSSWHATCVSESEAMRPDAVRRLGAVLNEMGQLRMRGGDVAAADACFKDGLVAFAEADDAANSALLLLNRAVVARRRADANAKAHEAASAAVSAGAQLRADYLARQVADAERAQGAATTAATTAAEAAFAAAAAAAVAVGMPGGMELGYRLEAVAHQRQARTALRQLRGGPPPLRAMVLRDLAAGEAACGSALHALIAGGGGNEESFKRAGECLSHAQVLYEEMGELAMVQQMMRQQGSLYLAASLCESLEGAGHERAASSRFTLAMRHYERALAPQLLAQAAVSPAMERCAAEARVELANYFLTRASEEVVTTGPGLAGTGAGERLKLLESALSHAKAGLVHGSALDEGELRGQLADAQQSALRELIKAHTAHGNAGRAAALKDEYRAVLARK